MKPLGMITAKTAARLAAKAEVACHIIGEIQSELQQHAGAEEVLLTTIDASVLIRAAMRELDFTADARAKAEAKL